MAAAISGFTPTTPPTTTTSGTNNQLSSGDFLNLMIKQLQQQDPLNPTDSNQLLTQMSQISTLQSNQTMVDSLSGLTLQQSIGAGSNLIGKSIVGIDDNGTQQQGTVTSIKVVNKLVRLQLDNNTDLPMANVTQIAPSTANSTASNASLLQTLLASSGSTTAGTGTSNTTSAGIQKLASLLSLLGG